MLKEDLPFIDLEGYTFNCLRCGNCCKVLVKTKFSKMKAIYRYDYQGKLSKSPFTTTTVYYNEIQSISNYINKNNENIYENFFPFASIFLKDFPIEFTYAYQVKTKGKWCLFYDLAKKACNIYPVRPLVCKSYPLYPDIAILNGSFINKANIAPCSSVDKEIRNRYPHIQDIMNLRFDMRHSTYEVQFPNQSDHLKTAVYIERKIQTFLEVWSNLIINPFELSPNMVKKYDRLDMSQFWRWLSENKEKLDWKITSKIIKTYKQKINALNELFNLNISDFFE